MPNAPIPRSETRSHPESVTNNQKNRKHHERSSTHRTSRGRPPPTAGHCRPVQRRNRRTGHRDRSLAGRRGDPHLPRRTLETPHETRRFRRRRRKGNRLDAARKARNGHVHRHRSRYPSACRDGPERGHRPALDRGPHGGQPLRHAGDRRRPARRGHPGAGEEPRQPGPRTLDRSHRTHPQRRDPPPGRHPPRIHLDRQEPLPQPSDVGHPHRAAPASAVAADLLRPEPHRRQA